MAPKFLNTCNLYLLAELHSVLLPITCACTSSMFIVCGYIHCLILTPYTIQQQKVVFEASCWWMQSYKGKQSSKYKNTILGLMLARYSPITVMVKRRQMTEINHHQWNLSVLSKGKAGRMHQATESHPWRRQGGCGRSISRSTGFAVKMPGSWKIPHIYNSLTGAHAESKIVWAICILCHLPAFCGSLMYALHTKTYLRHLSWHQIIIPLTPPPPRKLVICTNSWSEYRCPWYTSNTY